MLKIKVLKTFTDKYTGKKHIPGDVLDASVDRCNELIEKGGFIKILANEPPVQINQGKKEIKDNK